jgi:ubiquinone/menaquinone biosynthesis C-methylase UbiE
MKKTNNYYSEFYKKKNNLKKLYPTEFVVRIFLSNYKNLFFNKNKNDKVLDLAIGDGRNTFFLYEQDLDVYGVEISQDILNIFFEKFKTIKEFNQKKFLVGRNNNLPFSSNFFDILLGCHVIYYCDKNTSVDDNINEIQRVIRPGGWFIASFLNKKSYLLKNSEKVFKDHFICNNDPYNNRIGQLLYCPNDKENLKIKLSRFFENFSFGIADNNYFGINEDLTWVVCQKKLI